MTTKKTITKRTYDRNVRKYAKAAGEAFRSLLAFADKYGPPSGGAKFMDELSRVVDTYSRINWDILEWCHRSGVNVGDFASDINNYKYRMVNMMPAEDKGEAAKEQKA